MNEDKQKREIKQKLMKEHSSVSPIVEELPLSMYPALNYIHSEMARRKAHTELKLDHIFNFKNVLNVQFSIDSFDDLKKDIYDSFVSANKGVAENKAAVSRLHEKIAESKKQRIKIEHQIKNIKYDILEFKDIQSQMEKYVELYSMFEKFLMSVAATSKDFNSVGGVLNRYETLENARKKIAERLEQEMQEAYVLRQQMVNILVEKATYLKKLGNRLIFLQIEKKEAKQRRLYWETTVERLNKLIGMKNEEAVVLRAACGDLYRKLCKSRGQSPTIVDGDIQSQLVYIQKTIGYEKDVYSTSLAIKQAQQGGVYNRTQFIKSAFKAGGDA